MGRLRFIAALWAGKLTRTAMRLFGWNATCWPGNIALKICPQFLKYVGKPPTIISITGTNGKTTTVNLTVDTLSRLGRRVLHNKLGTNVLSGIASSLMLGCGLSGRSKYDIAVFETDERSTWRIYPFLQPTHIVITNLYRDSIMRNAHSEFISGFLNDSIPPQSLLILNGDDPISFRAAPSNPRVHFGIGRLDTDTVECVNLLNDMRVCPLCQSPLIYEYRHYHHIGKFRCSGCGFHSPEYDYGASDIDAQAGSMLVSDKDGKGSYRLINDSIFNVYNMLAAITVLRTLGIPHEDISGAMESLRIVDSRFREDREGDIRVVLQLAKGINALAVTRAFDYVTSRPGPKQLLVLMSNIPDEKAWSENICWMYDCDFEFLGRSDITRVVIAGPRVKDIYFRLLLAGVPREKIFYDRDELKTPEMFDYKEKSDIYIFQDFDSHEITMAIRGRIAKLARESN